MQKACKFRLFLSYADFSISYENRAKNRYAKSRKKLLHCGANYTKNYYMNYIIIFCSVLMDKNLLFESRLNICAAPFILAKSFCHFANHEPQP